jgi:short-subunit dehydrogenase
METQKLIAVITGATSGIGRSFAYNLAEKGYDLILTGRRKLELENVADNICESFKVNVEVIIGDLANSNCRSVISNRIKSASNIDVLINNAGFGIDRSFYRIGLNDIRSMMITHDLAAVEFIHAALPVMMKRGQGNIINVSSLGAFIPGFTRSLYLATKSFLHYFTKALSMEVYPYGIRLQSLCPGMTYSDFHERARKNDQNGKIKSLNFMSPDRVVEMSLKSLKNGNVICIPGKLNKIMVIIAKALPVKVLRLLSRFRLEKPETEIPYKDIPDFALNI